MKLDLRPRYRNSGRLPAKDAPRFLEWMRKTHGCAFRQAGNCEGKIEAMHLDFAGKMDGVDPALGKGASTKVADRYAIPGCRYHAQRQTDRGWDTFIAAMRTSREALMIAAARLWHAWPGRRAWEAKQGDAA